MYRLKHTVSLIFKSTQALVMIPNCMKYDSLTSFGIRDGEVRTENLSGKLVQL